MEKVAIALVLFYASLAMTMARGTSEANSDLDQWLHTLNKASEAVTRLRFYNHDIVTGPGLTAVTVAQGPESYKSPSGFGIVDIMDDFITEGPEPTSNLLGRIQGIATFNDQKEKAFILVFNFVFTSGKFNGSTLAVLGRNPVLRPLREMPIVGGTGAFRLARGIITTKTIEYNATTYNGIYEYNLIVFHY